jgi:hypothetical protein
MYLQCNKYIISEFTPSTALRSPLIPGTISAGIIFAFSYMYTHYFSVFIFLPLFPTRSPTLPCPRTCSVLLFSHFVEEKKIKDKKKNMMFLLVLDIF